MAGFFIPDPRFEMPELLIPGRKPIGPVVIDWDKSLTRGLEALFIAQGPILLNLMDSSNNIFDVGGEATFPEVVPSVGMGLSSVATSTDSGLTSNFKISSTSEYTIAYHGMFTELGASFRLFLMGQTQAGGGSGYDMGGPYFGNSGNFNFFAKNGGVVGSSQTGASLVNKPFTWSGRYKSGESSGTRQHINGVLDGVGTISGAAGTSYPLQIGRRWANNDVLDSVSVLIPVWGRGLSDPEILAWHSDPYNSLVIPT
jgi:hypothetical protein